MAPSHRRARWASLPLLLPVVAVAPLLTPLPSDAVAPARPVGPVGSARATVPLTASASQLEVGDRTTLRVRPPAGVTRVLFQAARQGRWVTVATRAVGRSGQVVLPLTAAEIGTTRYRARFENRGRVLGTSSIVTIRVFGWVPSELLPKVEARPARVADGVFGDGTGRRGWNATVEDLEWSTDYDTRACLAFRGTPVLQADAENPATIRFTVSVGESTEVDVELTNDSDQPEAAAFPLGTRTVTIAAFNDEFDYYDALPAVVDSEFLCADDYR
ncbi:hypothetical protein [Nocardioides sp.]|uniref:hypothetical protein n=1 Tax=Nocardioides sp. TaxID=35761 RepID=UPI003517AA97